MTIREATAESIARRHIEFIKSRGEKHASAMAALMLFEKIMKNDPNVLGTLRTEYSFIEVLARVMKEEIERMEEEEK